MNNVNKTLYIPLYGKAYVSQKGIILNDKKAEEIWAAEGFALKGKSKSKWLAYYMGMRSAVIDAWLKEKIASQPDAVVIHIGCGMDSRIVRVGEVGSMWYDVDFPDVIGERRRYYPETEKYRMIESDARENNWIENLPKAENAIIVMEGVSMYMQSEELIALLGRLRKKFGNISLIMDCYTTFAAKASKYKNPINDVGVTTVYGIDDPKTLENGTDMGFIKEHEMTPAALINQLKGSEKRIFKKVFAGRFSKKMYRLYEYKSV